MTTTEPMCWSMWAGEAVRAGEPTFVHASQNHRYPQMYGTTPVRVIATEDPDGRYWSWVPMRDRATGEPVTDAFPVFVYNRESQLSMCFPYGYDHEEELGNGRMVRLTIVRDETADPNEVGDITASTRSTSPQA